MNNALRAKETASQIISNKDINIEATNKVKAKSVDIYAKNDVNISGDNGVEISTANNSYDDTTKQSSSKIGANFGVNPAIVNTVENVKNIKELTDFSGNSYDILNNASKVVDAIKDGAKATIAVADTNYKGATDAGYDNLKIGKNIFTASVSYNKSESKSSVHNETVEKSSLVSGNNMNIKSKNGNISISGTDVPNTSIKHDKVDKEQINRASAINTDFEISGKKTSAEDLGFNTDISRAQEKTKDEERHLDAELHTDLIGEDKRNEIKYAFKKLGSLHEILDQKKFKESIEGVLLDKFKDEHQKEFNLIKEESLSLEDKQKIAQNLVERYLRKNSYQGEIPEVLLTDEAHSFTVDSKDKETGAKRKEKIYFSINDIADPNLAFSELFGHEKAHMNTYDERKYGEDTSIHTTKKIGSENKNKVFTEEEKAAYLNNLRDKYKNQKNIEQQFAEAKLVPEKDKEHFIYEIAIEVLEKNPYIVEDTLALIDSALLLNLSEEEVRARAEKNKKELDKLFGNNDKDEIDNLNDIKSYKSTVISNNEDIKKVKTLDVEEDTLVMLTKGSTKNERKSNPKKVTKAKEELKELNKKPNKTPEDKRKIKVIEKKINKELSKMQKSENHSQIGKHS